MTRPRDVVAFVVGCVLCAVAGAALWRSLVGSLDWAVLQVVAPAGLVAVGVLGLVLSRARP